MALAALVKKALPNSMKRTIIRWRYDLRSRRFRPDLKRRTVEGVTFDFWIGDPEARDWYDLHSTDPVWLEMRFVRDHMVRPGDVVFDCGSHHGSTGILFSHWVGATGKVVCFEAMPANCAVIRKNIDLNRLPNVTLVPAAVGREPGRVTIDPSSNSAVMNSGRGIDVPQTCLDAHASLQPTLLKIDVEGFEQHVLTGARNVLLRRPRIVMELHPNHLAQYGSSMAGILDLLRPLGYRMWLQRDDHLPPAEYDGAAPITRRAHLFCM